MIDGLAYHRIILDEQGRPVDYVFLEVNDAFERFTGLKRDEIIGKSVREVLPGIENDSSDWIGTYGKVALTGRETRFDKYSASLNKWYSVAVYSPIKEHFVTIFEDITERKRTEEELLRLNEDLGILVLERTRLYSVLAKINGAIVRVRDRQSLFEEVCRILVETGSFKLAWVGILDPESRKIRPVASFGESAYLEGIKIKAADVPEGKGPTGRAVYEDHYVINTDFEKDSNLLPWREKARAHSLRSSSAFPLHANSQVIGALTIYSDKPAFFTDEEVGLLISLAENISFALDSINSEMLRTAAEDNLRLLNEELEARVQRRTAELEAVNKELEAFSYTISHDLKAPLRSIQGFARAITEDYGDSLDEAGMDYLRRINSAGERMTQLIEAMLEISRLTSRELMEKTVNLSSIAEVIAYELKKNEPDRKVEFLIAKEVKAHGDSALLEIVLRNLLDNAFKFTSRQDSAKIEFGVMKIGWEKCLFCA